MSTARILENETGYDVKLSVIDGLFDLRAMALAGYAMSDDAPNEDMNNMGRVLRKIAELAMDFIRELDGAPGASQATLPPVREGGTA